MHRGPYQAATECGAVGVVFQAFGEAVHELRETKKADVVKHPKAFHHVGLLVNKPTGATGLLFI